MSGASACQQARSHLAYLRLTAAAEALPAELEHAATENLGHTAFLERLLDVEVTATNARRRASLERSASLPLPFRLGDFDFDAQPGIDKKLVRELATLRSWPGPVRFRIPGSTGAAVPATIGLWPRRARIRPLAASVSKARPMERAVASSLPL